jgi:hypothetical protein
MMRPGIDYLVRIAHGYGNKDRGAVVLPQWLYDRAKADGIDLSGFIRKERIPIKSVNQNKPTLRLK